MASPFDGRRSNHKSLNGREFILDQGRKDNEAEEKEGHERLDKVRHFDHWRLFKGVG